MDWRTQVALGNWGYHGLGSVSEEHVARGREEFHSGRIEDSRYFANSGCGEFE
jgi:hypothetical protein